jgi:predicted dienelactone hydrolase
LRPLDNVLRKTIADDTELHVSTTEPFDHSEELGARLMAAWVSDMSFVIDRLSQLNAADPAGKLTGRIDMARVGAFGHSFGGAQAAQFCHDDARCKAAIDIDGAPLGTVVSEGMQKPFMLVQSGEGDFSTDAETATILADFRSLFAGVPADRQQWVSIRGANHFTFSDDGAVMKSAVVRGLLRAFGRLQITGRRQLAVTAYCVSRFFDAYLRDGRVSRLDLSSPLYPEVVVGR